MVLLARFLKGRRAGVTPLVAMVAVPLMGAVGAAVDYSHAATARSALPERRRFDHLAMSKDAAKISRGNWAPAPTAISGAVHPHRRPERRRVGGLFVRQWLASRHHGQGSVRPYFVNLLGWSSIPISATATTEWGSKRLRVALALDTTGSMDADGKMPALKTAAKNLINSLKDAAVNDGDVYISIVRSARTSMSVPRNVDANWVGWSNGKKTTAPAAKSDYKTRSSCTPTARPGRPRRTAPGPAASPAATRTTTCRTPRRPRGGTLFPAEQYSCARPRSCRMSYDWAALKAKIDTVSTPVGGTNQPIGLAWGWQSLTEGAPLNAPAARSRSYKYEKIVILMSDGLNTQDRWYGNGSSVSTSVDRPHGQGLRHTLKAAGITVYSIQVNTGGDARPRHVMKNLRQRQPRSSSC